MPEPASPELASSARTTVVPIAITRPPRARVRRSRRPCAAESRSARATAARDRARRRRSTTGRRRGSASRRDAGAAQAEQHVPRQRATRRRHLDGPRPRRVGGLHRLQRQQLGAMRVLHRRAGRVERLPQRRRRQLRREHDATPALASTIASSDRTVTRSPAAIAGGAGRSSVRVWWSPAPSSTPSSRLPRSARTAGARIGARRGRARAARPAASPHR